MAARRRRFGPDRGRAARPAWRRADAPPAAVGGGIRRRGRRDLAHRPSCASRSRRAASIKTTGLQRPGAGPVAARDARDGPSTSRCGTTPRTKTSCTGTASTFRRRWTAPTRRARRACRRAGASPLHVHARSGRHPLVSQPQSRGPRPEEEHLHRPVRHARRRKGGEPGAYDQEVPLLLHEWEPRFTTRGPRGRRVQVLLDQRQDAGRRRADSRAAAQRVLFRIVNASATLQHSWRCRGTSFQVVALDGNPVPHPSPCRSWTSRRANAWTRW